MEVEKPAYLKQFSTLVTVNPLKVILVIESLSTTKKNSLYLAKSKKKNTNALSVYKKNRQGETILRINGESNKKIADLAYLLPMQVITPEGLTLLNGGPIYRRAFLDWGLFHQNTDFYHNWNSLKRLLKQRNAALVQTRHYNELKPWDVELSKFAQIVSQSRAVYAESILTYIEKNCQFFLPELEITATFYQGWEKERDYADLLAQGFERDRSVGYTMVGPQKADFRFRANGLPVEDVLSRGQLKLLMCALRLAQGEYFIAQKKSSMYLFN